MNSFTSRSFASILQSLGRRITEHEETTIDNPTGKTMVISSASYSRGSISRIIKENNTLVEVSIILTPIFGIRGIHIKYSFYRNNPTQLFNLFISDPEGSLLTILS